MISDSVVTIEAEEEAVLVVDRGGSIETAEYVGYEVGAISGLKKKFIKSQIRKH